MDLNDVIRTLQFLLTYVLHILTHYSIAARRKHGGKLVSNGDHLLGIWRLCFGDFAHQCSENPLPTV